MFKTILFPIDRSRDTQEAVQTVVELVRLCQSKLILLSVQNDQIADPDLAAAIASFLEEAKTAFSAQGIIAETLLRQGKPAFVICDVADELQIDLIVMGCRGTGLTQEGINESVSNRVINLSSCPVLVVP
ncbi:universal stress protein [Candidatus Synechococcus calcipolaris G9]|uniref:Universal stress protein n=1 Tax=Candidatus Synechococcus calcipolaris G9 TaxID=1497997 RepID=A0ABT6F0P3_9SYNE|nr:universal stress protein [Candidatus Synechococcus calcipolaris]MDG2991407.1 universal stress protein [Candidatus Synechococcus calcipolaris G9]